jgi:hypothetical protein
VKLGLGTITKENPDGLSEFSFDDGEAQTVATRDDFENAASNIIPMWDAVKRSFVPSGKTMDDFVPSDAPESGFGPRYVFGTDYLGDIKRIPLGNFTEAFRGANTPIPTYFPSTDGTPESPPENSSSGLYLYTSDPTRPYHAVSKHYADENYRKKVTSTSGSYIYTSINGVDGQAQYGSTADPYLIPHRTGNGNLKLPDQITTAPSDNDAISKAFADAHYVAIKTNTTTLNQVYVKTPAGEQTMVNMGVGAESGGIAVRDTNGQLRLPNQINNPPELDNMAVSKGYTNMHYVALSRITPIYAHLVRLKAADLTTRVEFTVYNTSSTPFTLADVDAIVQSRINTWATYANSATKKTMVFISSYADNTVKFQMLDESAGSVLVDSITDTITMCFDSAISANATVEKVYRHKLQLHTDADHFYTIVVYNTSNIPFTDVDTVATKVAYPTVATYSSYPEDTHEATVISSANSLSALASSVYDTVTPLSNLN